MSLGTGYVVARLTVYTEPRDARRHERAGKTFTKDGIRWCVAVDNGDVDKETILMIVRDYHERYITGQLKGTQA